MQQTAIHRRLPRAGIDPIADSATAFAMLAMSVSQPRRHETIVLLLDEARCGRSIVVVADTLHPDSVIEVVECLTHGLHAEDLGGIVVATVRPGEPNPDAALLDADVDRWLEMSDVAGDVCVDVLEWWVIGESIRCPRDRLGEPPRW